MQNKQQFHMLFTNTVKRNSQSLNFHCFAIVLFTEALNFLLQRNCVKLIVTEKDNYF